MNGHLKNTLICISVPVIILTMLFAAGWNDWKTEKISYDEIPIKLDEGWSGSSDNIYALEPYPESYGGSIAIAYEFDKTKYAYCPMGNIDPGVRGAIVNAREYENISELKNNTSPDAIFFEKAFLDETGRRVLFCYAIILGNEVDFAYRDQPYGKKGYASRIINKGNDTLEVEHKPSFGSYFCNFIFPDWVIMSVAAIFIVLCVIDRRKK